MNTVIDENGVHTEMQIRNMRQTLGKTLEYEIIGINHDDLADGSGKAGLTFLTTSTNISSRMNAADTNAGGWEKSELRAKMNSGEIWNLMPSAFQSKVKSVRKLTNNVGGGDENKDAAVTATSDKLFLLSYSEIAPTSHWASSYPWTSNEGTQYEAFQGKVTEDDSGNGCLKIGYNWWERSAYPCNSASFLLVSSYGDPLIYYSGATYSYCVCPTWCFLFDLLILALSPCITAGAFLLSRHRDCRNGTCQPEQHASCTLS